MMVSYFIIYILPNFFQYYSLLCSFCVELYLAVRNDIMAIMLNRRFVEELFKPQELYSGRALRTVFDKLAHASIMRLNTPSMDKVGCFSRLTSVR